MGKLFAKPESDKFSLIYSSRNRNWRASIKVQFNTNLSMLYPGHCINYELSSLNANGAWIRTCSRDSERGTKWISIPSLTWSMSLLWLVCATPSRVFAEETPRLLSCSAKWDLTKYTENHDLFCRNWQSFWFTKKWLYIEMIHDSCDTRLTKH